MIGVFVAPHRFELPDSIRSIVDNLTHLLKTGTSRVGLSLNMILGLSDDASVDDVGHVFIFVSRQVAAV